MVSVDRTQSPPWSLRLADSDIDPLRQTPFEGIYTYLMVSICILGLLISGMGPLSAISTPGLYEFSFLTRLGITNPHVYIASNPLAAIDTSRPSTLSWLLPWANYTRGRVGWYRQGLRDVKENRALIESLVTYDVPDIMVAAAIAIQGNSPQRPFGWQGIEVWQRWLGNHVTWPFPQWLWAQRRWEANFVQHSIGIGQIMPGEVVQLGYAADRIDLLDDATSIDLMRAKLAATSDAALSLGLNKTDWFILVAIGNNGGIGTIDTYQKYGGDMEAFLAADWRSRDQLGRIMTNIDYLHNYEDWPLPEGVNFDHVWWLIREAQAGP